MKRSQFGLIDNSFLSRSIGTLDPRPATTAPESCSVADAVKKLREARSGCIVVVGIDGKLAGIFTERDALTRCLCMDPSNDRTPLREVMTQSPKTAQMTMTIGFALNTMSQGGYRHLPLVDQEQRPVGILSPRDLIDFLARSVADDVTSFHAGAN